MSLSTRVASLVCVILFPLRLLGQVEQAVPDRSRITTVAIVSGVAYGATLYGLSEAWYSGQPKASFHFFNDDSEWKQIDKAGHFYSAFYFSYAADHALQWAKVDKGKSGMYGSLTGSFLLVPVEVMDGFSSAYGASVGDLVADFAGAGFYLAQIRLWEEPRIFPKFSFHRSDFARLRPAVLGSNGVEELLKDYNGQTYWLSVDMDRFVSAFPKWLNLDVGYGADGMVFARDNENTLAGYHSYRQYYLGLDIDLRAINTRSRFLRSVLDVVSLVRLPAPAMEFSRHGALFKPLFF